MQELPETNVNGLDEALKPSRDYTSRIHFRKNKNS
jgi:hypothetical protein